MRSGDWGNLFILANSGLFLASVILQNAGVVDWHSASFVEDGFCVTAPKTWRSSHAMSFYADAIGAGALAYLAKKYAGEPFAEPCPFLQARENYLQGNERAERDKRVEATRGDMRCRNVTPKTLEPG